jgi:sugar phosphate isomerase/epimerase
MSATPPMRTLSLAHLTLAGSGPLELIDAAAQAGFDHIGMRIVPPTADTRIVSPLGDAALRAAILRRLADAQIKVLDIEAFWLSPSFEVAAAERAFVFGAEMGAQYAIVAGNDPERARLLERLDELCERAVPYAMRVSLEFMPYTEVRTAADASACVFAIKRPNAGLLIDALHLSRSGGSPADLAAIPTVQLHYLHLCDASATPPPTLDLVRAEARGDRLYPGEGELPLAGLIAAVPANVPIAIEAPHAGLRERPWAEQARLARTATLRLLEHATP